MRWAAESWRYIAIVAGVIALGLTVLAAWARERALARFGDKQMVRQLRDGSPAGWRAARAGAAVLAITLLGFAIARPQGFAHSQIESRKGIDIIVCLDVSKSMLARDVNPSRIAKARTELRRLMEEEPGDRIGVVVFAGGTMEYPLTTDHESAERFMSEVEPWAFPVPGTSISRAIIKAIEMFSHDQSSKGHEKVIIVITDGEDLNGDPIEAAKQAKEAGIRVYVDAIGSTLPEPIPAYNSDGVSLNSFERLRNGEVKTTQFTATMEEQLKTVASVGNGRYFRAAQGQVGIEQVRNEIRNLRRAEIAATRRTVYDELMAWAVFPALLLLILGALIPERVVRSNRHAQRAAWVARTESK